MHYHLKWSKGDVPLHVMTTTLGVEIYIHLFLTLALDGGEWLGSLSGRFSSEEGPLALVIPFNRQLDAGCYLNPVWARWGRNKSVSPSGNQTTITLSSGA
jgi:hypothetical protein